MSTRINRERAEQILNERFLMKYVKFIYPGYDPVYGRCDRICIGTDGTKDEGLVLIVIGDKKYSCSPESLNDCLTHLTPEDGNIHTGGGAAATGPRQDD